ncbi:MAG: PfkB family carbohydrate kinase [Thermodesulfobacteriota bacterium]
MSEIPEFLAVGHVTHDHVESGKIRLGGAALYSSLTAHRLGKKAAVLTSLGEDFAGREAIEGIAVKVVQAPRTSTFRNVYGAGGRTQFVYEEAAFLAPGDLPANWARASVAYLCPVLHEFQEDMGEAFTGSMIGVAPQGWMRTWDETGRVRGHRWEGFECLLDRSQMVIVSEEDIAEERGVVELFRKHAPIVIVTRAGNGATVFAGKRALELGAYAAVERDPTGAGDCFGSAFLIRYEETGSIEEAARFASCVGAFVVEKEGIAGIPAREPVESRMREERVSCEWDGC